MNTFSWQVLLLISCFTYSFGQVPFDCNGRSYRVLAADGGTYLQEIHQDQLAQTVSFKNLHFYPEYEINAIAYHPSQNVIYGVIQTPPYRLARIDATFEIEVLQTLPLSAEMVFVSGDISPDEQYLVLFGFGNTGNENIFALVDVQNGEYDTQILPMQTTNPEEPYIYCADIAFHPTTGKLFGFDFRHDRLVTLDIANRIIDNTIFPKSTMVTGNIPSIFFSATGELFGIGATSQDSSHHRAYYQFDLGTGQGITLEELGIEKNQDACSCPYRIELLNEVRQRKNSPCTELAFKMTLINKTDFDQFDLTLVDTFPQNVSIKSISPLSFDGTIENSLGNNILTIRDLYLPIGTFSFEIILDIAENVSIGNLNNQAVLSGISLDDIELKTVLSDDPVTAIPNDATAYSIDALVKPFSDEFFGICRGGEAKLHTGIYGANSYEWSTGESSEAITVDTEGNYEVTITTDCDEIIGTASVTMDEIELELGRDQTIESGETVSLKPTYSSQSHVKSFSWQATNSQELNCPTCQNIMIQPLTDTEVQLVMENGSGCRTNDQLLLRVEGIKIYAPTAFSPDNNNQNDSFFLQGNLPYDIEQFQIFDRWGSLLYQNRNLTANEDFGGWDGTKDGRDVLAGVYIWTAVIRHKNGSQKVFSGDVTLVR